MIIISSKKMVRKEFISSYSWLWKATKSGTQARTWRQKLKYRPYLQACSQGFIEPALNYNTWTSPGWLHTHGLYPLTQTINQNVLQTYLQVSLRGAYAFYQLGSVFPPDDSSLCQIDKKITICQLDTNGSSERRELHWENASIRRICRQALWKFS